MVCKDFCALFLKEGESGAPRGRFGRSCAGPLHGSPEESIGAARRDGSQQIEARRYHDERRPYAKTEKVHRYDLEVLHKKG
jgi:hypothetical protein